MTRMLNLKDLSAEWIQYPQDEPRLSAMGRKGIGWLKLATESGVQYRSGDEDSFVVHTPFA